MNFAIDPNVVYLTPTGRRCRWLPMGRARGAWSAWATFVYLDGSRALRDEFTLMAPNFGILRLEGC